MQEVLSPSAPSSLTRRALLQRAGAGQGRPPRGSSHLGWRPRMPRSFCTRRRVHAWLARGP
eukprot:8657005-Pyramimonas_sp.AAC.1